MHIYIYAMDDDQFQQPGAADELPSLEDEVKSVERKLRSSGADKRLAGYLVTMWVRSFMDQYEILGLQLKQAFHFLQVCMHGSILD